MREGARRSTAPMVSRGESSLWAAVIDRAVEDALGNVDSLDSPGANAETRSRMETAKARAFLLRDREVFPFACQAAGVDAFALRERVAKMLEAEK